jgi:hypothetical protein
MKSGLDDVVFWHRWPNLAGDDTQTDPAPPRDRRVPDHRSWRLDGEHHLLRVDRPSRPAGAGGLDTMRRAFDAMAGLL